MGELKISKFGTIYGEGFKEVFIDDFLKNMEKKLGKTRAIYYEKNNNRFQVVYDGYRYYLKLDDVVMDNYTFGNYNSFTLKLKQLVDKSEEIEARKNKQGIERRNNEEIIEKAKKNIIPNDEAREIYVEYLKNSKRFSLSKVKKYFSNLGKDIVDSNNTVNDVIWERLFPFKIPVKKTDYCMFSLILGVPFIMTYFLYVGINDIFCNFVHALLLFMIPSSNLLVPISTFLGTLIKNRFKRLKKYISGRKILNHKIKQLTKELNSDNLQSLSIKAFDKTFENSIKEDLYNFKDQIMNEINKLVDRLNYINSNDRSLLLKELQDILNEYIDRINNIENQDENSKLQLDKDNILKLKMDMISRISSVESRMLNVRMRDIASDEREHEQLLLEEKIDNCYINMDDINEEVARREGNKERVLRQQRTSEVNRRHI